MTFEEILSAARQLDWDHQSLLILFLQEEMRIEMEATPLTEEQIAELERRVADIKANPDNGVPWEEVRDSVRHRLRQREKE